MSGPEAPSAASLCTGFSLPLLLVAGLLLAEIVIRSGEAVSLLTAAKVRGSPRQSACDSLFGLMILGTAYLGLGLCGLLYPSAVAATALILAAFGRRLPLRIARVIAPVRALTAAPSLWLAIPGFALAVLFPIVSSPTLFTIHEDAFVYHLAFPWQSLVSHRIPLDHVAFIFHIPMPFDLACILPLVIGDDRLAKWMIAGALLAGSAFIAGSVRSDEGPAAMWLPLLLMLSVNWVLLFPGMPKNDMVAAACFVAGAMLWRDGSRSSGALLLGSAVATKLTCGPMALAWIVFHPPKRSARLWMTLLFTLPVLPWFLKSWLSTGNPFFPAFWTRFASPFWGPVNQAVFDMHQLRLKDAGNLVALTRAWSGQMWQSFPLFLLLLPAIFLAGRIRAGLAILLGSIATLGVGGMIRYAIPGLWIEAVEVAGAAVGLAGRRGIVARWGLVTAALVQLSLAPALRMVPWAHLFEPAARLRRSELTTYARAIDDLSAAKTRRVLLVGAWRSYLMPCRVLFNGYWGEYPVVWSAVNASTGEEDLRRRFRQLGASAVLFNVVSVDPVSWHQGPFMWTDRMLRLYHGFCRKRLVIMASPGRIDRPNGGFFLLGFDLASRPKPARPPFLLLPGAETAVVKARIYASEQRFREARAEFRRVMSAAPGTAFFVTQYAYMEALSHRWERAHSLLRPLVASGYTDAFSLKTLGLASAFTGRTDEAIVEVERCVAFYDMAEDNRIVLALIHLDRAHARMGRGLVGGARSDLDAAGALLKLVPPDPKASYARDRRRLVAMLYATKGELELRLGHANAGKSLYREALQAAPELPEARAWKGLAK